MIVRKTGLAGFATMVAGLGVVELSKGNLEVGLVCLVIAFGAFAVRELTKVLD